MLDRLSTPATRKQWLDETFGTFNTPPQSNNHGLHVATLIYQHLLEKFRPFMEEAPCREAMSLGAMHPAEPQAVAARYAHTLLYNTHGECVKQLVEQGFAGCFSAASGSPQDLTPYQNLDAVVSIHTLNFFDDAQAVVNAMAASLAPQGRLYLAVQNGTSGTRQLAMAMGILKSPTQLSAQEERWGQRRYLDLPGLIDLVEKAGLRPLTSGGALLKTVTEGQMQSLISNNLVGDPYLQALFQLGEKYPELCSTVYVVAGR